MRKKRKAFVGAFMAAVLILLSGNSIFAAEEKQNPVTITSESQLVSIFPDPVFRALVFGAVKRQQGEGISIHEVKQRKRLESKLYKAPGF